jgi:hypothetical protein
MNKYYCKNCRNEICSVTYLYGRKLCRICSRKLDWLEGKYNKRNYNRENNPNHKHGKCCRDNKCIDCGIEISRGSLRCPLCDDNQRSLIYRGKNHHLFGKMIKPKFIKYRDIYMRSSWEVAYAKYLTKNKTKWLYESKTFDLGNTTYTPDFYLPKSDTYVEIKGYESDVFIKKFKLFKIKYKNIKIKLLKYEDLLKIHLIKRR